MKDLDGYHPLQILQHYSVSKLADVANSLLGRFPNDQEPDVLLQLAFIPRIVRRAFERP